MLSQPRISVIIPAFNEEVLLAELLQDLQKQDFEGLEVIVADAGSSDSTRLVAENHGAKVVLGGLPAVGRNAGARAAQGEFLFFLDADVRLPAYFLSLAYGELQERYLDLATCPIVPLSDHPADIFLHDFTNLAIQVGQFVDPHAPGSCVLVSRRLYQRVGGFNEDLKLAEDHDFVKRASAFRPLRVLNSTSIHFSVRRLEKEGRVKLAQKYLAVEFYRSFKGEIREDVFDYEFGEFTPKAKPQPLFEKGQLMIDSLKQEYGVLLQNALGTLDRSKRIPEAQIQHFQERFEQLKNQVKTLLKSKDTED